MYVLEEGQFWAKGDIFLESSSTWLVLDVGDPILSKTPKDQTQKIWQWQTPIPKYKRPQGMTGASIKWGKNARKDLILASKSSPKGMFQQEYEHIVTKHLTAMVEL